MFTVSSTLIWAVLTVPTDWVCHIRTLMPCVEAVAWSCIIVTWWCGSDGIQPWSWRLTGLIVPEMTCNVLSDSEWDIKQPTNQPRLFLISLTTSFEEFLWFTGIPVLVCRRLKTNFWWPRPRALWSRSQSRSFRSHYIPDELRYNYYAWIVTKLLLLWSRCFHWKVA